MDGLDVEEEGDDDIDVDTNGFPNFSSRNGILIEEDDEEDEDEPLSPFVLVDDPNLASFTSPDGIIVDDDDETPPGNVVNAGVDELEELTEEFEEDIPASGVPNGGNGIARLNCLHSC